MAVHPNCFVIGVMGGKGGVGKSVMAANLALTIQMEARTPVLLIDADSKSCGDQNVILGLRPTKTLSEVAKFTGGINPQTINTLTTKHPSGMSFIGAVRGPDEVFNPPIELVMKAVDGLSRHFKYIVLDLGNDIGELQMNLIAESTGVVVVTVPEVLTVNQTKRAINDLMAATLPGEMIQVVINKMNKNALAPNSVAQTVGRPILGVIPQDDLTTGVSVQRSQPFVLSGQRTPLNASYQDISRKLTSGILQKLKSLNKPKSLTTPAASSSGGGEDQLAKMKAQTKTVDTRTALKLEIHNELIKAMDLKKGITDTQGDPEKEERLRNQTQQQISKIVDNLTKGLGREERGRLIKEILDEALGLGPLEDLLADDSITEIMVNGHHKIFVEKSGKLTLSPITFTSNLHLRNVIERIVTPLGRRIDEKTPYVDARLQDGSRVNAIIEPLSIDGPALTIRKFRKQAFTIEDYLKYGSCTREIFDFLKICVEQGLNIVISGGTGSGKTTLLNVMSGFIPATERIVTVEDAAELQLQQEHVVRLETRPANMEGTGAVTIRDLIKNSLRMRPDRVVVGETRDGAALDMLQAMNTGHDGSMTTTHANNPREAIARLQTLCMMAGMELPGKAIKEQIASAVHLIIQISRLSDGSRKIMSVTEVAGMQGETITQAEIFRFKEEGFDKNRKIVGTFQAMGLIPSFIEKLEAKGVAIPRDIFSNKPRPQSKGPGAKPGGAAKPKLGSPMQPRARKSPIKKGG